MIRTSESLTEFAPAFVKLQAGLPNIARASEGGQKGSKTIKYASLDQLVTETRELLAAAEFAVFQGVGPADRGIMVTTRLLHKSGEWMEDGLVMPVAGGDAQAVGSAISYGRRYGYLAVLGIAMEDDDGAAASKAPKVASKPAPRPGTVKPKDDGEVQLLKRQMFALMRDCGYLEREERLKVAAQIVKRDIHTSDDLSVADLRKVNAVLQEMFDHLPADGERVPE